MTLIGRRAFLKAGAGLAALSGPLAAAAQDPPRVRGIIWLWMDGGMSGAHTFDPKPGARVQPIESSVPGIKVSELMKACAAQAGHLTLIRSMTHGFAEHGLASWAMHAGAVSGLQTDVPVLGSIVAHELSAEDLPLPPHVVLDGPTFSEAPVFGDRVLPFRLQNVLNPIPNLRRNVDAARDSDRSQLLLEQNREWSALRKQREVACVDQGMEMTSGLMNTPRLRVFNIDEEPSELRAAYGTGFGEGCLVARRLIQAGCSFVEVGLKGWDTRSTGFLAEMLDKALGTLISDLEKKDLLRDIVVVCAAPFGRGPAFGQPVQARGFSVALAGGFLSGGRVYGDTGRDGTGCVDPVSIVDLFATIYRAVGLDEEKIYERDGRKLKYLTRGKPIEDLF